MRNQKPNGKPNAIIEATDTPASIAIQNPIDLALQQLNLHSVPPVEDADRRLFHGSDIQQTEQSGSIAIENCTNNQSELALLNLNLHSVQAAEDADTILFQGSALQQTEQLKEIMANIYAKSEEFHTYLDTTYTNKVYSFCSLVYLCYYCIHNLFDRSSHC